jgi:hypothetical protein
MSTITPGGHVGYYKALPPILVILALVVPHFERHEEHIGQNRLDEEHCNSCAVQHRDFGRTRRLGQIDTATEEAARRGKTNAALSAIEGQRKARAGLVEERKREAGTLAAPQAERATAAAKRWQIEMEAAPIRHVAELIMGASADSEQAIRWLIALMVLCCDRLAIALTAAAPSRAIRGAGVDGFLPDATMAPQVSPTRHRPFATTKFQE